jgi:hypothetical protein
LQVLEIARELAARGAFIVPQESASFRYSGGPILIVVPKGEPSILSV